MPRLYADSVVSGEKWMDSDSQKVKQPQNRLNRSRAVCMWVLSKESDSAKLDAWIAELPLNLQEEGKEISVMGFSPRAV